jgi:hypothetical protein
MQENSYAIMFKIKLLNDVIFLKLHIEINITNIAKVIKLKTNAETDSLVVVVVVGQAIYSK